jgi:hypothetical protein
MNRGPKPKGWGLLLRWKPEYGSLGDLSHGKVKYWGGYPTWLGRLLISLRLWSL